MAIEIKVPTLGESLTEATVATWLKSVGDAVAADEPILELETDKVTMEVNAPVAGTLTEISAEAGAEVEVDVVQPNPDSVEEVFSLCCAARTRPNVVLGDREASFDPSRFANIRGHRQPGVGAHHAGRKEESGVSQSTVRPWGLGLHPIEKAE